MIAGRYLPQSPLPVTRLMSGEKSADAQHTFPWRQDFAPGNWDNDKWELYNLAEDFSEANDLAEQFPDKLAELKKKFDEATHKYNVLPLDDRGSARLAIAKPPVPGANTNATTYTYYPGAIRIAEPAAPPMKNKSWTLSANIDTEGAKTEGVIMAFGGVAVGITLYLDKGVPVFDYNYFEKHTIVKADRPLPEGKVALSLDFAYKGAKGEMGKGADITLSVNGEKVAENSMDATVGGRFGIDTFGIGEDSDQPVTHDYAPPFKFTGKIGKVVVAVHE